MSTRGTTKDITNVSLMMSGWTFSKSLNVQRLVSGLPGKLKYLGITFYMLFSMVLMYTGSIRVRCNDFATKGVYIVINDPNV